MRTAWASSSFWIGCRDRSENDETHSPGDGPARLHVPLNPPRRGRRLRQGGGGGTGGERSRIAQPAVQRVGRRGTGGRTAQADPRTDAGEGRHAGPRPRAVRARDRSEPAEPRAAVRDRRPLPGCGESGRRHGGVHRGPASPSGPPPRSVGVRPCPTAEGRRQRGSDSRAAGAEGQPGRRVSEGCPR